MFLQKLLNPADNFLFQPPRPPSYSLTSKFAKESKLIQVDAENFVLVNSSSSNNQLCFLWAHGNASDCAQEAAAFVELSRLLKADFFCVEFPGYGCDINRPPSELGIDRSMSAALIYARSLNKYSNFVIGGRSIGTGPACRLAAKCKDINLIGVVLWSSIASIRDSCANLTGSLLAQLVSERWSPIEDIRQITCPILFLTAERDSLTPVSMCDRVRAAAIRAPYTFKHVSETADHNENWDFLLDITQPMQRFIDFIQETKGEESQREEDDEELTTTEVTKSQTPSQVILRSTNLPSSSFKVVVIGCGPVGLWTACSLAHLGVKNILCLDKYVEFQRSHVLRLQADSLANSPPDLQKLCQTLTGVTRTNILEQTLAAEAKSLNIQFRRPYHVESFAQIQSEFKECEVFIACDGAHSVLRGNIFGGIEKRQTIEYVLDIRVEVISKTKPSKLATVQFINMLGNMNHIAEESVGKTQTAATGSWPMTLRLLISGREMKKIKDSKYGSARNPMCFPEHDSLFPEEISHDIRMWLETRKRSLGKDKEEEMTNMKGVAVDLNCYRAKQFACSLSNGKCAFLVGDSAFGVPFFRALNNGLLCGTEAAKCIVKELSGQSSKDKRDFLGPQSGPQDDMNGAVPVERIGLISKSFGVSMASVSLSSQVSQILANASMDVANSTISLGSGDPLAYYDAYVRRLSRQEFALAASKRDGLEIVKFGNMLHSNIRNAMSQTTSSLT